MAKGVRVGTGYIEITAEVTEVTKKVRSALDEVSGYGAGAGAKLGKELSGGIYKGIDAKATATKIVKDLSAGISPTSAGTQIGKELSTAIVKGVDAKAAGQKAGKDITTGVKQSHSALRDALKEPFDDAKKDIQNWGHEVAREIRSGDIQGAANDVGNAVNNITNGIYNLGTAVGIHLDAVKGFGNDVVNVLNTVGTKGQTIADDLKKIPESLKGIHEGGAAGKIQAVANSTDALAKAAKDLGINLGDTPDKIVNLAGAAAGVAALGAEIAKIGALMPVPGSIIAILASLLGLKGSAAPGNIGPGASERQAKLEAGKAYAEKFGYNKMPPGYAEWLEGKGPMPQEMAPFYTAPGQVPPQNPNKPGNSPFAGAGTYGFGAGSGIPGGGGQGWFNANAADQYLNQQTAALTAGQWSPIDAVAARFNLSTGSRYRSPSGPAVAGVPASSSWHGSGRATDYSGTPEQMLAFANYMATTYGPQLKELIYDAPGFVSTINNGKVVGPFGAFYTLGQAGYHGDHVHIAFDEGGVLPPGVTIAVNNTGQPEIVLPPDIKTAGDVSAGTPVGQTPDQLGWQGAAQTGMDVVDFLRTAGFIPTGAGSQAVAGTSFIAGLLNLGNEAVAGLIDTGAQAATMAISMAASAAAAGGSMGSAGPAAGAAGSVAGELAGIPIQIAAEEAKRAVSWGFQMAAIGADALVEQLFPLGAPRWVGYDYTAFMPKVNISGIGTTTVEKMMSLAQQQMQQGGTQTPSNLQQPGGPVSPQMLPGMQPVGTPVPALGPPGQQTAPSVPGPEAATAPMAGPAPAPAPAPAPTPAPSPTPTLNPADLIHQGIVGTADEGGWFMPNTIAANTTNRPELVLSPTQLNSMASTTTKPRRSGDTYYITAVDAEDVARQIDKRKALAAMRYMGRP